MKGVLLHALLAALGLGWAYQTWTQPAAPSEKPSDEVVLLDCKPDQLESLELELASHTVALNPTRGKDGVQNWMVAQQKKKPEEPPKPSADAGTESPAEKPAAPPAAPAKPQARVFDPLAPVTFLASKKLDAVLAGLLPVRALRELGVIETKHEADFGLDKVTTHLRVACGGQKLALEVGGRTYGVGDYYVRDLRSKKSYLLPGKLLSDLQSAQFRLMQNDLHDFSLADVDEAVIEAGGKTRRLSHRNRQTKGQAQWVDASAPDRRNELYGNWFQRVGQLRARGYLERDAAPGSDLSIPKKPPVSVVTIELKLEGKPKGKLEIVRVDTDEAGFYYARSEATHAWVTLYDSLVKPVEEDIAMVVAGEDAASAAPAP